MKRANGTGTLVKLSGNRRRPYAVHVPGRDERGRVIQRTLSYHERAQKAQEALTEYNRLKAAGTTPAADKLSLTVTDVFQGWSAWEYRKLTSPPPLPATTPHGTSAYPASPPGRCGMSLWTSGKPFWMRTRTPVCPSPPSTTMPC